MLYWQRKSFLQEKYEDASEYAVHGEGNLRDEKSYQWKSVFEE